MPRRKQEAPRRSAAYVPEEELKAAELNEDLQDKDQPSGSDQEHEFMCEEEEEESKEVPSCQNSPVSTPNNPEPGYGSPASDTSDQLAELQSTSSKEGQEKEEGLIAESVQASRDSLAQMKAAYSNLLSSSYWTSLGLDLKQPNQPSASTSSSGSSSHNGSSHNGNGGGVGYDWHQAALAKTLQQTPYGVLPESSLFSTVQLYRQHSKLFGSVFTGASKFRCKDCSSAYDTLVDLTVHMNETGHYRDDNKDKDANNPRKWSKPRKRSLMEMEGKEDAQKVLKCMYCGHSFESLQDLSVHMIKTKHYQKVPLKEPVPALASKLLPPNKRRVQHDIQPCSPESAVNPTGMPGGEPASAQKAANPYVTPNNRYGYQNGASYTWQFEARKAQILKCMECGSSHDTLQQLTAHMMVTGHFLKVTNSASKKGKQLVFDVVGEEKIQSIPLPPSTPTKIAPPTPVVKPEALPPPVVEPRKEHEEEPAEENGKEREIKEEKDDCTEKFESTSQYQYLREEDLDDSPKGGIDILKSLENTVTSAINKAQNGAPTWGGYSSIHAAYQLSGSIRPFHPTVQNVQLTPFYAHGIKALSLEHLTAVEPSECQSPPPQKSNVHAMEELVEKVTGKMAIKSEDKPVEKEPAATPVTRTSCCGLSPPNAKDPPKAEDLDGSAQLKRGVDGEEVKVKRESNLDSPPSNGTECLKSTVSNGCNSMAIITDHSPESPFVNPLSALQSIMNTHLGKAAKPLSPSLDPLAMLYKISNSVLDKPIFPAAQAKQADIVDRYYYENNDQPMDLTKSKSSKKLISAMTETILSSSRENALLDISDMVKNLTGRLTPKSSTPSTVSEKSEADVSSFEDTLEDISPVQKRKGRQSNWNPQHLLILQAQFAASLRESSEGKYIMSDLNLHERVHISKFTGLSMTTISHWLANVKYQLRRTGGTKFLKNLDTGHPVFFCNDCASQFRTPSGYIGHLESHLGFSMKDLSKLSIEQIREQQAISKIIPNKTLSSVGVSEEDISCTFQCKMCNRTFASKHAVKLHLSKTHGKSPEDHLLYVTEFEKQ
ncbi:teashirt homolog 1 isoform X1 [Scyliorhinus canicula]|uniref:teashirt homolog 1 isoform X1 n=2 Tax=Scyliorhinus canicula TaxID=7830 RepID=UPI0018F3E019|nr:teashirt homolog 1 isoform X1 [Scyliorhinus canicula]